ncbi:MAG: DUF6641 family protein, partial [Candidatus Thiodiazotropha endolucinida]
MTVLDTLNFVAFNPLQNNNPIAVRRRKLIAKIDEQIQLAANKDYTPTQHKWVTDEHGYASGNHIFTAGTQLCGNSSSIALALCVGNR